MWYVHGNGNITHTNLSLHYSNDNNLTTNSSLLWTGAHTRFSFVLHSMVWVHDDNISLCTHLSLFAGSHSANCCALHSVPTLTSPLFITGCECIMIIFPCAHLFSPICRFSHRTNSALLWTGARTRFSFVRHSLWVYFDNISLCTHLFSLLFAGDSQHQLCSALNWCTHSFLLCPSQYVSVLWLLW